MGIQQMLLGTAPAGGGDLDAYTANLWAVCSLKKLITTYAGPCLRIRRSSDNAEQDINFIAGVVDIASATAFCGASNGFVTKFYDQFITAHHFQQTTNANQPQVVTAGVWNASGMLEFDGTSDSFVSNTASGAPSAFTVFLRGTARAFGTQIILEQSPDYNTGRFSAIVYDMGLLTIGIHSGAAFSANYSSSDFTGKFPNNDVSCYRMDRAQPLNIDQTVLFTNGTKQARFGNIFTGVLDATYTASAWNLASRNQTSLFSSLNVHTLVIYEDAKTDGVVSSISTILQ